MRRACGALLLFLVVLSSTAVFAGTEEEIAHLLSFIEQSDCIFIRNGKEHSSTEGLEHIRKKHAYLKERITSAETFIEHAASKSSLTGKAYLVRCGEEEAPSAEWLGAELERYRESAAERKMMQSPDERSSP